MQCDTLFGLVKRKHAERFAEELARAVRHRKANLLGVDHDTAGKDVRTVVEQHRRHDHARTDHDGARVLGKLQQTRRRLVDQRDARVEHELRFGDDVLACRVGGVERIAHVTLKYGEIRAVLYQALGMRKMADHLGEGGCFYVSFKYGEFQGERNGRYFTDMTEESFQELLKEVPGLAQEETFVTGDVREGRNSEKWLNVMLKKVRER